MLSLSTAERIAAVTSANRVVVFSKTTCPHCRAAKKLLRECGVDDVLIIETDQGDGELLWPPLLLSGHSARAAAQVLPDGRRL
jgi:hypothetical protein